jgi:hypothetical protein
MGIVGMATMAFLPQDPKQGEEPPFACNLRALTSAEREDQVHVASRLLESLLETRELADGYAFEFDSRRISFTEITRWIDLERRCCPFFDFHLELRRNNGPITVRLTGRDGVKAFIRTEFPNAFR